MAATELTGTGNVTTASSGSSTVTSLSCTKPANVADGDLLVARVTVQGSYSSGDTCTESTSAWTACGPAQSSAQRGTYLFYLPVPSAAGLSATSWTWQITGYSSSRMLIQISRLTGVNLSSPVDVVAAYTAGSSTAINLPSITPSQVGDCLVGLIHTVNTAAQGNPTYGSDPSILKTLSRIDSVTSGSGSNDTLLAVGVTLSSTSATGTQTFSVSNAQTAIDGILVAFAPAPAAASGSAAVSLSASGAAAAPDSGSAAVALTASGNTSLGGQATVSLAAAGNGVAAAAASAAVTLGASGAGAAPAGASAAVTLSAVGIDTPQGNAAIALSGAGSAGSTGSGSAALSLTAAGSTAVPAAGAAAVQLAAGQVTPTAVQTWLAGPRYVAHRGGDADWVQCTSIAYANAAAWNSGIALEVPVVRTSDGYYMLSDQLTTGAVFNQNLTIGSSTKAQLQALRTTTGNYPPMFLDSDILPTYAGRRVIFLDAKNATSQAASELRAITDANGGPGWWVYKAYYSNTPWISQATSGGYVSWPYLFPADTAAGHLTDANVAAGTMIGIEYDDTSAIWAQAVGYGKPVLGHVIANTTEAATAYSKGASGLMVSGVVEVIPNNTSTASATITLTAGAAAASPAAGAAQLLLTASAALSAAAGGIATIQLTAGGFVITYTPPPERTVIVAAENRTRIVAAENRTVLVAAQS